MKISIDTSSLIDVGRVVGETVGKRKKSIDKQITSRGTRAAQQLRNAELQVLRGKRSGKIYRKYPYRSWYRASAPGEPPARRTGTLRLSWSPCVKKIKRGISVGIESSEKYAEILENGTSRMAHRPFRRRIQEKAYPEIKKIFAEPYN